MQNPNIFQLENFLLSIASVNSVLLLEAEEQSSGKIFAASLDNDSIAQITKELFDKADSMAEGLKEAINSSSPDLKLTIDLQGKLTYSVVLSQGVINKRYSFTLNLTEKAIEPIDFCRRRINSVKDEIDQWKRAQELKIANLEQDVQTSKDLNEKRIDRLENIVMKMEQTINLRLNDLEKLCEILLDPRAFKLDVSFNSASFNISKYDLSDNNKTATRSFEDNHVCLEFLPQVPRTGRYACSLRINAEGSGICFGLTTEREVLNWNNEKSTYRYWTPNGKICGRVQQESSIKNFPCGGKGRLLKMIIDMDQGTLTFFADHREINSCKISKSDKYFAYVSLGNIGDSVTLL